MNTDDESNQPDPGGLIAFCPMRGWQSCRHPDRTQGVCRYNDRTLQRLCTLLFPLAGPMEFCPWCNQWVEVATLERKDAWETACALCKYTIMLRPKAERR